jgi:hypothetical protein
LAFLRTIVYHNIVTEHKIYVTGEVCMRYALSAILAAYLCLAVSFGLPGAYGQETVPGLSDLVGAKAGQAENTVQQRGYTWVKTEKEGGSSYSYWTESGSNKCVTIRTEDGRYKSIVYAPAADCGNGTTAAAAVAPAAVEAQCKLFNSKSNNYKYDGSCKIMQDTTGSSEVIDVTLGNGDLYHFVEQGGGYKVQTPEGSSDHQASMNKTENKTVFDWYKWQLTIKESQ